GHAFVRHARGPQRPNRAAQQPSAMLQMFGSVRMQSPATTPLLSTHLQTVASHEARTLCPLQLPEHEHVPSLDCAHSLSMHTTVLRELLDVIPPETPPPTPLLPPRPAPPPPNPPPAPLELVSTYTLPPHATRRTVAAQYTKPNVALVMWAGE